MEIMIPFTEWSRDKISKKLKHATSRYEKFGSVEDYFFVNNKEYILNIVVKLPLWFICNELYKSEGCESKEEFEKVWISIHPKKGFKPNDEVWYHHFIENF